MTTTHTDNQHTARNQVLAIVLTSYLMIVLDISIVITGLPDIQQSLGFSPVALSWVQNAYLLSFGGFLLLAARAGDLLGRKRMLLAGLALFTTASLAVGLATTPAWLIGARAVQGIGAAILAPSVLALISTTFPEGAERTRALSYYSMVAGAGSAIGLVLGGYFAGQISWRVGFFINVPIGIVLMASAARVIRESELHTGALDLLGALTSTVGMISLVFGIVQSAELGWSSSQTLTAVASGLVLLAVFVAIEARAVQPIMPLRLFASRQRSGAYLARMLFLGGMVSFFYFTTQFLQRVLSYTPFEAGLAFLPMSLMTFVAAMRVPGLTRRLGNARVLSIALGLTAAGLLWLSAADEHARFAFDIALPMAIVGFGNGLSLGPLTVAGVAGVADQDQGAASGVVNVFHQLGGSLGLGLLVVVFASSNASGLTGVQLLSHRIGMALTGAGFMLTLSLVAALLLVLPAERTVAAQAGH
ncbi:MAG: MFS transporter [Rhodocyclales bacterium]|jgi:EmrB/QacA subfamily drug resistance transporter|nr:MFS transporter [Rhodocyclales bacterium]